MGAHEGRAHFIQKIRPLCAKAYWGGVTSNSWFGASVVDGVVIEEARHQNIREKWWFLRRATFLFIWSSAARIRTKKIFIPPVFPYL